MSEEQNADAVRHDREIVARVRLLVEVMAQWGAEYDGRPEPDTLSAKKRRGPTWGWSLWLR